MILALPDHATCPHDSCPHDSPPTKQRNRSRSEVYPAFLPIKNRSKTCPLDLCPLDLHFRQDIIENMKRLTCDFERNIFLPELEQSCVIYATDMILEYKKQWGSALPPYVVGEISDQVIDVYLSFFSNQFLDESISRCKRRIKILVEEPDAQEQIRIYYQKVNQRYAMHF